MITDTFIQSNHNARNLSEMQYDVGIPTVGFVFLMLIPFDEP